MISVFYLSSKTLSYWYTFNQNLIWLRKWHFLSFLLSYVTHASPIWLWLLGNEVRFKVELVGPYDLHFGMFLPSLEFFNLYFSCLLSFYVTFSLLCIFVEQKGDKLRRLTDLRTWKSIEFSPPPHRLWLHIWIIVEQMLLVLNGTFNVQIT